MKNQTPNQENNQQKGKAPVRVRVVDNTEAIKELIMLMHLNERAGKKEFGEKSPQVKKRATTLIGKRCSQVLEKVLTEESEHLGKFPSQEERQKLLEIGGRKLEEKILNGEVNKDNLYDIAYQVAKEEGKNILKGEYEEEPVIVGLPNHVESQEPKNHREDDYETPQEPHPREIQDNHPTEESSEDPRLYLRIREVVLERAGWEIGNFKPEENQSAISAVASRVYSFCKDDAKISEIELKKIVNRELKREFDLENPPQSQESYHPQTASQYAGIEAEPKKRLGGLGKLVTAGAIIVTGLVGGLIYKFSGKEIPKHQKQYFETAIENLPRRALPIPKPKTKNQKIKQKETSKPKNITITGITPVQEPKTSALKHTQYETKPVSTNNSKPKNITITGITPVQEPKTSALKHTQYETKPVSTKTDYETKETSTQETPKIKAPLPFLNAFHADENRKEIKKIETEMKKYNEKIKEMEKRFEDYEGKLKSSEPTPEQQARQNLYRGIIIAKTKEKPVIKGSSKPIKQKTHKENLKPKTRKPISIIPYEFPSKELSIYAGKRFSNNGDASITGLDYNQEITDSKWFWGASGRLYEGDNTTKTSTTMSEIEAKGAELEARLGRSLYQKGAFRIKGNVNFSGGLNYEDGWIKDTSRVPEMQTIHRKWYNTKVGARIDFDYKKASIGIGVSKPVSGRNNSTQKTIKFKIKF
ncbi:hypothetical protein DRN73_03765 [Candidatus Pacearchaeota archaeon]|nr:MAG: hypothetical protein DRN73_03765 [Candidatus Pacearchaeota archaeon]